MPDIESHKDFSACSCLSISNSLALFCLSRNGFFRNDVTSQFHGPYYIFFVKTIRCGYDYNMRFALLDHQIEIPGRITPDIDAHNRFSRFHALGVDVAKANEFNIITETLSNGFSP